MAVRQPVTNGHPVPILRYRNEVRLNLSGAATATTTAYSTAADAVCVCGTIDALVKFATAAPTFTANALLLPALTPFHMQRVPGEHLHVRAADTALSGYITIAEVY